MKKETPIKFKKEYGEVTFEIEVNSQTTVEDFRQIKETFDNLYDNYRNAETQINEEKYFKAQRERENNMLNNPCYYCMGLNDCKMECKGKKTCNMYVEYPF